MTFFATEEHIAEALSRGPPPRWQPRRRRRLLSLGEAAGGVRVEHIGLTPVVVCSVPRCVLLSECVKAAEVQVEHFGFDWVCV